MAGNGLDEMIGRLRRMRNDWPDIIMKAGQKAAESATNKSAQEMLKEFRPNFEKCVDAFYNSYTPQFYNDQRRYSMYDVFQLETTTSGNVTQSTLNWDDSAMTFRGGETGLMDLTFGEGYHGGASGTDRNGESVASPHYRRPLNYWSHWGSPAVRSESPFEQFDKWSGEYWEGPTFQKLFEKYCFSEFERELNNRLS